MSLSYFMKAFLFTLVTLTLVNGRNYNTGLIFYDLKSLRAYLPPTVSVLRGRAINNVQYSEQGSIWSTFGKPCECKGLICGCCAGLNVKQFNFDQKMCANVTYAPQRQQLLLEVLFDEKPASKYGISTRNPSPLCIPIMMGIPMAMCVQMSDIAIKGNNLNMCMDFVVRLATTDLFEMHFQCMRMGLDGIQYLDKDGKPVIPSGNIKTEDDYYDDESAIDVLTVQNYNDTNDSAYDNEIDIDVEKEEENVDKPLKTTQNYVENEVSKKEDSFETKEEEEDEANDEQNMVEDIDDNIHKKVNNDEIEDEESIENVSEEEKKDSNAVAETHEVPQPMTTNSISEEVKEITTELNDLENTYNTEVNPIMTAINANDSKSIVIDVITAQTTEPELTTKPAVLSDYHSNESQVSMTSTMLSTTENVHKLAVNNSPAHYASRPMQDDNGSLYNMTEKQKQKAERATLQLKTVPETNSITFYKRLLGII